MSIGLNETKEALCEEKAWKKINPNTPGLSASKTVFLGKQLNSHLVLAPLAGVSDASYRYICGREGAALAYTEMISAKGLYYKSPGTAELYKTLPGEAPLGIQLFGSEPEMISFAVEKLADEENILFDINMGCPVPKVVKNGEGSSLLANKDLAARLVEAAVEASRRTSKKPITVKMRIGFGAAGDYVGFAKTLENAGASAVAVHARTREQYYSGEANWDAIKETKSALSIPVIGNGDVRNQSDADKMLEYTGCDLVMIGRGSMGNPWIFNKDCAENGSCYNKKVLTKERIRLIEEHFDLLLEYKGETRGCMEMRKYFAWYTKGISKAASLRSIVNTAKTPQEIKQLIDELKSL